MTTGFVCRLLSSCTVEHIFEKPENPHRLVRVLFAPEKLGDMSFNDDILQGIMEEQQRNEYRVYCHILNDMSEADSVVFTWQNSTGDNGTSYVGRERTNVAYKHTQKHACFTSQ